MHAPVHLWDLEAGAAPRLLLEVAIFETPLSPSVGLTECTKSDFFVESTCSTAVGSPVAQTNHRTLHTCVQLPPLALHGLPLLPEILHDVTDVDDGGTEGPVNVPRDLFFRLLADGRKARKRHQHVIAGNGCLRIEGLREAGDEPMISAQERKHSKCCIVMGDDAFLADNTNDSFGGFQFSKQTGRAYLASVLVLLLGMLVTACVQWSQTSSSAFD